jgi:hypothetical protein
MAPSSTADTAVTCPTCGTISHLTEINRDAASFCRVCDYPLFWTRNRLAGAMDAGGDSGLRRLPGTAGRVALAMMPCPECTEPNPVTARICIRCGADLHPAPVVIVPAPLPPPPLPAPPAPAPKRVIWPWVLLGCVAVALIALLVILLVFPQ